MFNLVIFGPPGSGKGTQSESIIKKYQLKHLSTGDLLRAEKNSGSELGKKVSDLMNSGNLVPNEMVQQMVEAFVIKNQHEKGFIFDGFPRTVAQAEWMQDMLKKVNAEVNLLLSLDVDDEELKKRIVERGKISGRTDDQDESIVENRIKVYHSQTKPVMSFYENIGKFSQVNGMGSLDEIFDRICAVIDNVKGN